MAKKAQVRYSSIPEDIKASIYAQAERTAWRNIHWWLKVQLTMIALRMVEVSEVFLPYMLVAEQETLYQRLVSGGFKALAAGKEQRL